jgi:ketosteroid isomerase-like protein
MKKLMAAVLSLFGVTSACASNYHGVVQAIRIAAALPGSTRVSVLTTGATDCEAENGASERWYHFEYARSGPGSAWLASLLSAHVTQAIVTIQGTGKCDVARMEGIAQIDLGDTSASLESSGAESNHSPAHVPNDGASAADQTVQPPNLNDDGHSSGPAVTQSYVLTKFDAPAWAVAFLQSWYGAYNGADAARIAALYSPDAFLAINNGHNGGRAATDGRSIGASLARESAEARRSCKGDYDGIQELGTLAVAWGHDRCLQTSSDLLNTGELDRRWLRVLAPTKSGQWLITRDAIEDVVGSTQ